SPTWRNAWAFRTLERNSVPSFVPSVRCNPSSELKNTNSFTAVKLRLLNGTSVTETGCADDIVTSSEKTPAHKPIAIFIFILPTFSVLFCTRKFASAGQVPTSPGGVSSYVSPVKTYL